MRLTKYLLYFISLFFFGIVLNACSSNPIETNMSEQMEDFSFKTQDEEELGLDDLKGDWWIAYLSYTDCRTVCPRTTVNMVDIQEQLKKDDLYPHIITFNVNPEEDTSEDLREYADKYQVDLNTWDFLTGYDFETIQHLSENVFEAALEKGAADQFSHSYMFYLINPDGEVIKKYDGMSTNEKNRLIEDLKNVL